MALITLGGDIHTTLTQRLWSQRRLTVVESDAMFFNNGEVCEEFAIDKDYVGHARNHPAPSFRVGVDCHKSYIVLIHVGDEEHPKPIWFVKAFSSPNFCSN